MKAFLLLLVVVLTLHTCSQLLPTQAERVALAHPTAVDVSSLLPQPIYTGGDSPITPVMPTTPQPAGGVFTVSVPIPGGKSAGAGFFVSPTTAITAFHVIANSRSLNTLDVPALHITYTNASIDAAMLMGPANSTPIYKLSTELPTVGEQLSVRCLYPYANQLQPVDVRVVKVPTFFQENTDNGSQVVEGSMQLQEISGTVRNGCSGSPVLNNAGLAVGMLLAGNGSNVQAVTSKTLIDWMAGK